MKRIITGDRKNFVKKQVKEIILNDIEDTLMIEDYNNVTFNINLRVFENKDKKPKMKQKLRVDLYIMETSQNYTEQHHLIPMAYSDKFEVSLDVEVSIVSLCSTCHNHIHYGVFDTGRLFYFLHSHR